MFGQVQYALVICRVTFNRQRIVVDRGDHFANAAFLGAGGSTAGAAKQVDK